MPAGPKVTFDPKLNFKLPSEIGPLLKQTAMVSIAETEDACYELARATQQAAKNFEKQLAVAQADAKEVTEKLLSAANQNMDTAFRYALKLAQAKNVQEYVQIQIEFVRTQSLNLMGQTQKLSRPLGKLVMHS